MKIMKHGGKCHKRLSLFTSTDETRYHLQAVHMSDSLKMCVSTDGVRMYGSKGEFRADKAGQTLNAEYFAANRDYVKIDAKYPEIKNHIPDLKRFKHFAKFTVPEWLSKFEKNKNEKIAITLDLTTDDPFISLTRRKGDPRNVALNAALLAPFAGELVVVHFIDCEHPVIITDLDVTELTKLEDLEWFALVMPLRAEKEMPICITTKNPPQPTAAETITEEQKVETRTEAKVLSIVPKLKEKEDAVVQASRLKCCECDHVVSSEDDWEKGVDSPPTKENPEGRQDSGIYVCPECNALQENTVFDGMVKFNPATGDIESNIPGFLIDDLVEMEFDDKDSTFNLGTAILNACRMDILRRYGKQAVETCFRGEREWLMEQLSKIKKEAR